MPTCFERTIAASINLGRETTRPDPMIDTQLLITYRNSAWIADDGDSGSLCAGDRAPDVLGLTRDHVAAPFRLHDVLRGTEHVLLVPSGPDAVPGQKIETFAAALPEAIRERLRLVAIGSGPEPVGVPLIHDPQGSFAAVYGSAVHLIRPDRHIGWRGPDLATPSLGNYLDRMFAAP